MAAVIRILLVLLPIAALLLWLRWRSKRDLGEEIREMEARRLRIGMTVLTVALLLSGLAIRFLDDRSGNADQIYIPDRVENGVLIPGKFVPRDEVPEDTPDPTDEESDYGSGEPGAS